MPINVQAVELSELKQYARDGYEPAKVELKRRALAERARLDDLYSYLDGKTIPLNQAALKYDVPEQDLRNAVARKRIGRIEAGRGGPGNVSIIYEKDVAIFVRLMQFVPGQGSWLLKEIYGTPPLHIAA